MICDGVHIGALSDGILPLLIKIEKILSDKGTICSNASKHISLAYRAAAETGGREVLDCLRAVPINGCGQYPS